MKRLAIAAVGLAVAAILAIGAGAFALYVWPGQEEVQQQAPDLSPRYTELEATGIVRAALSRYPSCAAYANAFAVQWHAVFEADGGKWQVVAYCEEGKSWDVPGLEVPDPRTVAVWYLCEDSGQLVPLSDLAVLLMTP
jgi:hypothetical protein